MPEFRGTLKNTNIDFESGEILATFAIRDSASFKESHSFLSQAELLTIKVDKYRKKRSKDANAYAWKLITEIASTLNASNEEVYEKLLKLYGTPITENDEPVKVILLDSIDVSKLGMHTMRIGYSMLEGKRFNQYLVLKGSSEMNTKEMSVFIDGIVSECRELGIPTITPNELREMKERWGV